MLNSNLDNQSDELIICSDNKRIQQVLLNLISNSLKFTMSGGIIDIIVKKITSVDDLTFKNESLFKDAFL